MLLTFVLLSCSISATSACPCKGCQYKPSSAEATPFATNAIDSSFQVTSYDRRFSATSVLSSAQQQRKHLYWHWQANDDPADWTPPCKVIIHATRASYTAAVGSGSEATFGSSWLDNRQGQCHGRRIDLLADRLGNLTAFPHELTHIAVSQMLGNRTPPRWLDEGIALLADSTEKQKRHADDLRNARTGRLTMRLAELMRLEGYPPAQRIPAFYAQSASLTAFLAGRDKPHQLLRFAELALDKGYDQALRDVYKLDGVSELEQAWLAAAAETINYSLARSEALP